MAAAPANEKQAFAVLLFFEYTCFELRDRSTSANQSVTLAKFLSRTKLGFEI